MKLLHKHRLIHLPVVAALAGIAGLAFADRYPSTPPAPETPAQDQQESHRTPGEVLDDSAITAKIKTSLIGDKQTKARHIDVDTHDGVVALSGQVDSDAERNRAVQIARNTKGVRSVNDQMSVGR
jgi:hyperosmotically inducible protein